MKLNIQILAAIQKALHLADLATPSSSGTPSIPHSKNHKRMRAHAPNDGRWHMKYHRSRSRT
jgi:hypothetical protein